MAREEQQPHGGLAVAALVVFLAGATGFWLELGDRGALDRLLDSLYFAVLLFVGAFQDVGPDPGLLLRIARIAAILLTLGTVIYLVVGRVRRQVDSWRTRRMRGHTVVIGSSPLALRVAENLRQETSVAMVVTAPHARQLALRRVRQVFLDPADLPGLGRAVERTAPGATAVFSLTGDDDQTLVVLAALWRTDLDEKVRIHLAFESNDVVAAFAEETIGSRSAGVAEAGEGRRPRIDSFRLADRALTAKEEWQRRRGGRDPDGRFLAHHLIAVGDGPLAEAFLGFAADAYGILDGVEITAIGAEARALATRVQRRNPWAGIATHEVDRAVDVVADTVARMIDEASGTVRVVVCSEAGRDAVALAVAQAIGRRLATPEGLPDGLEIAALIEGATLPTPARHIDVWSVEDALADPKTIAFDPWHSVERWSGIKWEVLLRAAEALESRGVLVVAGATPAPLTPAELRAVRDAVRDAVRSDAPDLNVEKTFEILAWAARLPIWLARCGYGIVRRERALLAPEHVDLLAEHAHTDYWNSRSETERDEKRALGQCEEWRSLPETWRVSNRDQAWMYPAYLAHLGFDIVPLPPADAGGRGPFPTTEAISVDVRDFLAWREHDRWSAEKKANGWARPERPANAGQDVERRRHDLIDVPWDEDAMEASRGKDQEVITGISGRLRRVGLAIRPVTWAAVVEQLRWDRAPRWTAQEVVTAERLEADVPWSTERGDRMTAVKGDWWVTCGTRAWSVAAARFEATYVPVDDGFRKVTPVRAVRVGAGIVVRSPEGAATTADGDWIVTDRLEDPAYWVMTDDEFRCTYAPEGTA